MLSMRLAMSGLVVLLVIANPAFVGAEIRLHGLLTDNAVLQRGAKVPVHGTTDQAEVVVVTFAGQEVAATPSDGKWRVELAPMEANSKPQTLAIAQGGTTLQLKNLLIGDVWLCGGQSNMAYRMLDTPESKAALPTTANDQLRLYLEKIRIGAPQLLSDMPQPDKGPHRAWLPSNSQSAEHFSVVGYYFGRDLQKAVGVPIGLIHANMGSTSAERWISQECVEANEELRQMKPTEGAYDLWNGMIFPITQFPIRGVLWYQGEANAHRAWQYRTLLPVLIQCWRKQWKNEKLPFLIVQCTPSKFDPPNDELAEMREAQWYVSQTVADTGLVVTTDLGDKTDFHPPRKREVGERLALAARAIVYGHEISHTGPVFDKLSIQAGRAEMTFEQVGAGLTARDGELRGFTIAGDDGVFIDAKAEIVENRVVAWSEKIRRPKAVRYNWTNFPTGNLFNKEGFPAAPFRTDDYPLTTLNNK